jgi:hypothetical protein
MLPIEGVTKFGGLHFSSSVHSKMALDLGDSRLVIVDGFPLLSISIFVFGHTTVKGRNIAGEFPAGIKRGTEHADHGNDRSD